CPASFLRSSGWCVPAPDVQARFRPDSGFRVLPADSSTIGAWRAVRPRSWQVAQAPGASGA
nr:hypothetical protein [Tanacetum cinerariifolium]